MNKKEELKRSMEGKKFYRAFEVNREKLSEEDRTVPVAFSSEEVVDRWFGREMLDLDNMDLSFLNSGRAPVLKDHDFTKQIGVVEKAWLDKDRFGRAVVRFGKSEFAQSEFQDIKDGIRLNISVGYSITEMEEVEAESERGEPVTYKVSFRPFELSTVAVPADENVGVGRSAIVEQEKISKEVIKMEKPVQEEQKRAPETPQIDVKAELRSLKEREVTRIKEIRALCARHDLRDLEEKAINEDVTIEQFRGQILDRIAQKPAKLPEGEVDMSPKEARQYSLLRAINAACKKDWSKAGLELECSRELAKKYGREAKGFFVPTNIAWGNDYAKRDLTVASTTGGAKLKGTDQRGDLFIDALRSEMLLTRIGATVLTGLKGDVDIPRLSGKTTCAFMANETTAVTEGAPTFDQVQLAPKTCSGWVDISRKLRYQSDPSVEQIVRGDIIQQIATKIEDVGFEGAGSGEPTGLLTATGINVVSLGTNGGAPTYAKTVDMIQQVAIDNALRGALNYVGTPQAWYKLVTTAKVSSTDSEMIMKAELNNLNGFPFHMSTNVPSDLTKGSGTSLNALFFGNFRDLLMAFWSGVDLVVDESSLSTIGAVRLVFFQDVDVGCRHGESFSVIKDMIVT